MMRLRIIVVLGLFLAALPFTLRQGYGAFIALLFLFEGLKFATLRLRR